MKVIQRFSVSTFTLFAFLMAMAIAEVGLRWLAPQTLGHSRRVKHPDFGEMAVPSRQGFIRIPGTFEFGYTNNSQGLREKREPHEFARYRHRILALGDSFTYGIGVNDHQTWAYRLEELIHHTDVAVINAGNEGSGTDYALRFFDLYASRYQANQCVVFFHFSDFENNLKSPIYFIDKQGSLSLKPIKINRWKQAIALNPIYNWLTTHSHLVSLLKFGLLDWIHPPVNQAFGGAAYPDLFRPLPASMLANTQAYLAHLSKLALSRRILLKFYYTPSQEDFEACRMGRKTNRQQAFEWLANKLNLNYELLTNPLACTHYSLSDLYLPDGHWTALGHALAAAEVERGLAPVAMEKVASAW